jgi:hypothetical protein
VQKGEGELGIARARPDRRVDDAIGDKAGVRLDAPGEVGSRLELLQVGQNLVEEFAKSAGPEALGKELAERRLDDAAPAAPDLRRTGRLRAGGEP